MMHDDELSNLEYMQQNPDVETSLWVEWVLVVCGWDKIDPPSEQEWIKLKANFYHGKAPIDSVAELKKIRTGLANM